ncbi:MAG TPA: thiol:disulfide interchange protein DsbA/DsbL [Rhodanobacteraceae bacterium]|nr:thiol:disulfide interchange protein DsbA/DsbL [Rhodanobacteraceae bacterium]
MRRPSSLIRFALLAFGLLLAAACSGHGDGKVAVTAKPVPSPYTAGKQYIVLQPPAGQTAPTGPVVLVEVFSYACPHCAEFAPYMDTLRSTLPKDVQVRYMPAVFNDYWMPAGQAFYAARELGVLAQTHDALFKAHLEHYPLNSLQDMAAWYARHGVDPQKFLTAATSPTTLHDMVADQHTEMGWGIDSTPTLVVGRLASDKPDAPFVALMRSGDFGSYADLQKLGLWMVEDVRGKP